MTKPYEVESGTDHTDTDEEFLKQIKENGETVKIVKTDSNEQQPQQQPNTNKEALRRQLVAIGLTFLFGATLGFNIGYTGVVLPQIRDDPVIHATVHEGSWIASVGALASPIGCVLGALTLDRMGRQLSFQCGDVLTMLGWILIATAQNLTTLCVGRVFAGIVTGQCSATIQIYLSEVTEVRWKGMACMSISVSVTFGTLLVYILGTFLGWRVVAGIGAAVPLIHLVASFFILPESPSWLVGKGQLDRAKDSLIRLRGSSYPVNKELESLISANKKFNDGGSSCKDTLKKVTSRSVLWPLGLLMMLFLAQQMSGAFVVIYYAADVFKHAAKDVDSGVVIIATALTRLVAAIITVYLSKRVNYRVLTISSALLVVVCVFVLGTFSYLDQQSIHNNGVGLIYQWVPAGAVILFLFVYTIGIGTVPWVMMGELFPQRVRGIMGNVICCYNYTLVFIIVKMYPYCLSAIGMYGTFWMYGTSTLVLTVMIYFLLPETRGKSLEEIEDFFSAKKNNNTKLVDTNHLKEKEKLTF